MDRLGVIGTSYRVLEIDAISRYHLGDDPLPALMEFREYGELEDILYLPTCNRIEYYYRGNPSITAREHRAKLTAWYRKRGVEGAGGHHFYALQGSAAARHLFRVACSLDSMVVGEVQILDQIKQAHQYSLENNLAGSGMTRLLEVAYSTAHKVRRETRLCERPVSVASLAAQEVLSFGSRRNMTLRVLLIGAGITMSKAGTRLASNPVGVDLRLFVANRSFEKGRKLAQSLSGEAISLDSISKNPPMVDAVMTAVSGEEPVLTGQVVQALQSVRKTNDAPLLIVDLGLPANTTPEARAVQGVKTVMLDDLKARADENLKAREGEIEKSEEIIREQMEFLNRRMAEIAVGPSVSTVQERFREVMSGELDRLFAQVLPGLGEKERKKLSAWAQVAAKRMAAQELGDVKSLLSSCDRCPTNAPCINALAGSSKPGGRNRE
ncbi:MAG: glutamyl-tRNA reductase [Deltaproteobacteria bacterium]|nr:glutamyl-tRNA reductase [Deltaproteobacteria bacterium]